MKLSEKTVAGLMLATITVSGTSPILSASEGIQSEIQKPTESDASSEVVSGGTQNSEEITSQVSEVKSAAEVVSDQTVASDIESNANDETITSEDKETTDKTEETNKTEETDKSEETSVVSEDSETVTSEQEEDTKAALGSDFNLYGTGDASEITALNQEGTATVKLSVIHDNQIKKGATVEFGNTDAFKYSNLTVEQDSGKLKEGTDYSFDGSTVTFLHDLEEGTDVEMNFAFKITSGSTAVLGALDKAIYIDKNNNGKFDGTDYNVSEPGFMVSATNGKTTKEDPVYAYEAEINGGSFTAEETKMNRTYKDGKISGTLDYDITNSGKFAIEIRSLYAKLDLVLSDTGAKIINSKHYNAGDEYVYPTTKISISVDGGDYLTLEHYLDKVTSTEQEYFNPGETVKLRAHFSLTKEQTKNYLDSDTFGSWKNFTKGNNALLTIGQEYGDNVFNGDLHSAKDVTVLTSLQVKSASKPAEDDKDTTTETKPVNKDKDTATKKKPAQKETKTDVKPGEKETKTEVKPVEKETTTDGTFVKMTTDNKSTEKESKTELANTGSTLVIMTGVFTVILAALVTVKRYVK